MLSQKTTPDFSGYFRKVIYFSQKGFSGDLLFLGKTFVDKPAREATESVPSTIVDRSRHHIAVVDVVLGLQILRGTTRTRYGPLLNVGLVLKLGIIRDTPLKNPSNEHIKYIN